MQILSLDESGTPPALGRYMQLRCLYWAEFWCRKISVEHRGESPQLESEV